MYISDYFIVDDSLILNINIYNNSDSVEVVSKSIIQYELLNDTFLKHDKYVALRSSYAIKYSKDDKINCKNCFYFYKKSLEFYVINSQETLKIRKSFKILNLNKINSDYSFLIKLYTYIPSHLNDYCPRIWTGNISCISQISKKQNG